MNARRAMRARVIATVAIAAALAACTQSADDRARAARARAVTEAGVAHSDVVQALATPQAPGRIIYDPPPDLSWSDILRTRPDLANPNAAQSKSGAPQQVPRDTNRTEERLEMKRRMGQH